MVVRCWVFGLFRFAWGQKIGHKAWWCLGICRMLSRLVDFFLEELIISGIGPKALCEFQMQVPSDDVFKMCCE